MKLLEYLGTVPLDIGSSCFDISDVGYYGH